MPETLIFTVLIQSSLGKTFIQLVSKNEILFEMFIEEAVLW